MGFAIPAVLATAFVFSIGFALLPAAATDGHSPPTQQLADGVFPLAVQCNEPRELYVRDSSYRCTILHQNTMCNEPRELYVLVSRDLLCLYESTYYKLSQRGMSLVPAEDAPDVARTVAIGMLAPLTGGAAGYGDEIDWAYVLALDHFNLYLEEIGEAWRLEASAYDTQTSSDVVMETIKALNYNGVKIVAGPSIDTFGADVIQYADANGMLLFSCCSETNSKSIEGDSLLRMIPEQSVRAGVLADAITEAGIKVIVSASRDDEWASGTIAFAAERFTADGGQAKDHIEYGEDGSFEDSHVRALADAVQDALSSNSASEVAVLYIGFEETYDFVEAASAHGILGQVRWFGADANTVPQDNAAGLAFAERVGITVIAPAIHDGETAAVVTDNLTWRVGRHPSAYAMFAYDVVHLIGHAMQKAQTSNPADVASEITRVSAGYVGASGDGIAFDPAGDRIGTEYALFELTDGVWSEISRYNTESMTSAPDLTGEETAWLEANAIRFVYDPA